MFNDWLAACGGDALRKLIEVGCEYTGSQQHVLHVPRMSSGTRCDAVSGLGSVLINGRLKIMSTIFTSLGQTLI